MKKLIAILVIFAQVTCSAMSLEEFLSAVTKKDRAFQSIEQSKEAAISKRISGDIALSPQLSLQGGYLDDQRPVMLTPTFYLSRNAGWDYTAALSQSFASGTQASVNANFSQMSILTNNLAGYPANTNQSIGVGALGVSLSQSLWKDMFGHATSLRHERERKVEELTRENFNLQAKQIIIDAESAFWDLLYLQQEQKLREESLQRAKKIESWVKTRFGNGIGDKADVLNSEGLVAARELELIQTLDNLVATQKKVADLLELSANEKVPTLEGELGLARNLGTLAVGGEMPGRRVRLDSYLSILDAKAKSIGSLEADESLKPDLVLSGGYTNNSFDPANGITGAYNNINSSNMPTLQLGLKLTWLFDTGPKNATRDSAHREALAANLKMERQLLESDSAWQEMQRRHGELSREVQAARVMSDIQRKKAAAEREKLEKGKTITSQVITAEQDAAESALTLTRLEAAQRKLESQARLFITLAEAK